MLMTRHSTPCAAAPRLQVFVSDLSATGVVRNAIAIANEAATSGYEVRLLTCQPAGVLRNEVRPDVTLINLLGKADRSSPRRSQLKKALFAYRGHCRQWRPDILLSAGNHGHLLSTIAWAGLPGTKVLRLSNDLDHGSPSLAARLWRGLKFRLMTGRADLLILVSRAFTRDALLCRKIVEGKALIIPNGVAADDVLRASQLPCPHPWTQDDSVPIVLAVGRHAPQKNFDTLLKAFALARRQRPMRLLFLGDEIGSEGRRLRAMVAGLGLAQDVDFVPATSSPFPYMSAASVLALPSHWEGSSNVLLEAMACGTPVIASRTAGDAEYVLDGGRHGLLVDPQDVDGIASALLVQTSGSAVEPGPRAWAFDRGAAMRRYVRLFDQVTVAAAAFGSWSREPMTSARAVRG